MTLADRSRQRLADQAADDLARVAVELSRVEAGQMFGDRLRAAQAGPRAASWDTNGHARRRESDEGAVEDYGPPPVSDPTGEAVANAMAEHRAVDRAVALEREFDRTLRAVHAGAGRLIGILAAFPPAHPAGEADRLALARQNERPEPGCTSCARLDVAKGVARWEPIDSRLVGPTSAGGRLAEEMLLCVWCHDKVRLWDRLPTVDELAAHHEGRRVHWPTDVPRPA